MSRRSARRSSASRSRLSSARISGGICLNWGCIPTKALLRSAEIYHYMQHAKDYGLAADNISCDIDAVVKRSRGVAKQLNQGVDRPDEEEQDHGPYGRWQADRRRQASRSPRTATTTELDRQEHHRRHRRAGARSALCQGRRQAHLDLSPRDGAAEMPTQAARHRIRRDRDRICQLLQ